jgi:hypothetical protein
MKLEEEPPIFSKQKVNFSPTDRITHMAVSNELLVLTMANNVLLRIDLRQPDKPQGNDILLLVSLMYLLCLGEMRYAYKILITKSEK